MLPRRSKHLDIDSGHRNPITRLYSQALTVHFRNYSEILVISSPRLIGILHVVAMVNEVCDLDSICELRDTSDMIAMVVRDH